jgi:hypothetical protein
MIRFTIYPGNKEALDVIGNETRAYTALMLPRIGETIEVQKDLREKLYLKIVDIVWSNSHVIIEPHLKVVFP